MCLLLLYLFITGSGKTLSYAVPLIESLRTRDRKIQRSDGVYAVVLVPTRELALQSLAVIKKLVQVSSLLHFFTL